MKQSLILLINLLVQVVALAQPATSVNTASQSTTGPVMSETAPRQPKATESPVYIKLYGLYGLLTPGVQISHSELQSPDGTVFIFKTANKGIGAGPRAGAGLGFIVSDFINLGIDADVLFGTALEVDDNYGSDSYTYTNSTTTTLKVLSIIPNITFKALSRPAYYIYNRLGLVGGIVLDYKIINNGLGLYDFGLTATDMATTNYTKNTLALGYQAALGIQFRLSQRLRGFAEVVAYNQSFKPKRLEVSSTNTFGEDITTNFATIELTDQGSNVSATSTQTGQLQRFNVAMNSVGVGVGLSFRF
ncbi:hypothetical protein [Spirosoma utsteinense]|uniref:Outer membrane protein beta-barrel domain-containing protein n=1 Tax=Spirosoma utsteinense TaxID=2585773 RepID=A0ABR6WCC9_9BACT|nr:hypothetical protein [Spirosoma utsteinense]MBC3788317.1 hypothetical protein [Spirosoma utsteinense]MBC3794223.1 hypothetical protein [Spirosoma utsteinense]